MSVELIALLATLCVAGGIAGITAGLFGNGGGFVVVPALLAVFGVFGQTTSDIMYVAVGTSLASIVVSSARSVQAHARRGAVDFQVLKDWAGWLVLGALIGLYIASKVDGNSLVIVFATGVLAYSFYFLFPGVFGDGGITDTMPRGIGRAGLASFLGGFSALLGIGGGTITVMTMTLCSRPVHQAVATASGVGLIIGLSGAVGFLILGLGAENLPYGSVGYINVPALIAIAAISIFTAPLGAKWAHSLNDLHLKRLFGVYLVIVSLSMYAKALG
ncbi:MAG: sulfite exporter TauE/SafE family protein [Pseudomonadota bacterium]